MKENITKDQAQNRLKELKQEEQILLDIINPPAQKSIMERINDMDDIFREAGINKETFYKNFSDRTPGDIALKEMELISTVLNEETILGDNDEMYFPSFNIRAGFVFGRSRYGYSNSSAGLGPRLCFKSAPLSDFAGRKLPHIYKKFYYNK